MDIYQKRRQQLMARMRPDSVVILPAAKPLIRNRDIEYPYRQDSDFNYLTGFNEPDAMVVLIPGRKKGECIIFCRDKDSLQEQWTGKRTGVEQVKNLYGAQQAFSINKLDEKLPQLIQNKKNLYYNVGLDAAFDQRVFKWVSQCRAKGRQGISAPDQFIYLPSLLHEMRLIKSPSERNLMRQAAKITVQAHRRAMKRCRPGLKENDIEAELVHEFLQQGAQLLAYPSIVAAGKNACILHYLENNKPLKNDDLLLIDAGAEYQGYAADVTRTFPINGIFNKQQKAIYSIVLAAQKAAINQVKPGNRWNAPHQTAVKVISKGLKNLGLLKGSLKKTIKKEKYKVFFMHGTGHWLGRDVHDVGAYKNQGDWCRFKAGMVLTIEPGIYISPAMKGIHKKWKNIGIRIEDDVLVTKKGNEILTAELEKEIKDIESVFK